MGHPRLAGLLDGLVHVQEKYDGSQFTFWVEGGKLRIRSKRTEMHPDQPEGIFKPTVDYIKSIQSKLRDDVVYRGEAFRAARHNKLCYGRCPNGHLVLFDVQPQDQVERYWPPQEVEREAARLGLEPVRTLYSGLGMDVTGPFVQELLRQESSLGGCRIEGIVVKNYAKFDPGTHRVLMGKYVSEQFKEKMREKQPKAKKGPGDIGQTYANENRWFKAVQHLRDDGQISWSPRDIPLLIKEAQREIIDEDLDEVKEALWRLYKREVLKAAVKGLAAWYKEYLLLRGSEDEEGEGGGGGS